MRRREFCTLVGGTAAAMMWPSLLGAQQKETPVIGFLNAASRKSGLEEAVTARVIPSRWASWQVSVDRAGISRAQLN